MTTTVAAPEPARAADTAIQRQFVNFQFFRVDRAFRSLTGCDRGKPVQLDVLGRKVDVPQAAAGVARFSFRELCEEPLGAVDYLAIARSFHTVLIDAIPIIGVEQRNPAKRFILLIDTLYDRHVKLIVSAATLVFLLAYLSGGRKRPRPPRPAEMDDHGDLFGLGSPVAAAEPT